MLGNGFKRIAAGVTAFLIASAAVTTAYAENAREASVSASVSDTQAGLSVGAYDYSAYSARYSALSVPDLPVLPDSQPEAEREAAGVAGAELSASAPALTYSFHIPEPGLYNLEITYYALSGKSKDVVFSLLLDGQSPFSEAQGISLTRIYQDAGEIKQDRNGNDLRPGQTEVSRWNTCLLANTDGYYDEPYRFAFEDAGTHTVTLSYSEESVLVSAVRLCPPDALCSYAEYSKTASSADEVLQLYEAENSFEKSSSMLYPTSDRSGPATSPSHYSKIRYNTIGQSNWSHQGQWISWKINVEHDGWYSIAFKARQNYQQGINSYRTLTIDDQIPFEEAKNIKFHYALNWYMKTLGGEDGEPYLFYLTAGEHTLRLTVSAGPMGSVLKSLSDSVLELNSIYRGIIMVTGTTPDKYRTYYLEESVPGLLDDMKSVQAALDQLYEQIIAITGTGGSQASVISEMSIMLASFIKKPLNIPNGISSFKDTIESLGSLILTLSEQPLELDYIAVYARHDLPSVKASFLESLAYGVKGFIASFTEDYNSVGSAGDGGNAAESITVWVSNGRDQAQILKNLIDNSFTPETGIGVKMSIVSTAAGTSSSTLVQATLAGKGPDVALFTPKDTPVNLAMRGALIDLSELDGFGEIYGSFYESAWIPYIYENGIYAVPETQNFDMLFYRSDIFEELGLSVPKTWDEFYAVIEILQKNNLGVGVLETNSANAGISSGISFFEKLLLQNGGTYYNESLSATVFNTAASYNAFTAWTELYSDYGLDRSFDFFNRFRTGEMPIGIMNFTTYNQLYAAAPEIRGLWKMAVVPGTVGEDGEIVRTETASGTGAVMLKDCSDKAAAWEFIRWWTGAQAQAAYGTELEASLGVVARYDTANKTAFESLGWTDSDAAVLREQWQFVTDIYQIPGNYFISRCLTNAFRTVVDDNVNPIRALNIYSKDMDAEITRKRQEFHLD